MGKPGWLEFLGHNRSGGLEEKKGPNLDTFRARKITVPSWGSL